MKVMTILGTRPEIIRLSEVIPLLDKYAEDHSLVHTGQNYSQQLSANFFEELGLRAPDAHLKVSSESFGRQLAEILEGVETEILRRRPDRILILGDTNSGMSAIIANRMGVPVYHMEAGNRCYDDRVPEEVNRRVIDHCSAVLLPYTNRSKQNLLEEGFEGSRIHVTGNPILEVIKKWAERIASSDVLDRVHVKPKKYFLVTAHRSENVDDEVRLRSLVDAMELLYAEYELPVIYSLHPRSKARANEFGLKLERNGLHFEDPFSFADFIRLEQDAFCVLSDSGTVQEETCILGIPNVIIRDVTERPETVDCGSTILSGIEPMRVLEAVRIATETHASWTPPAEYMADNVASTVSRIVLGYRVPTAAEQRWLGRSAEQATPALAPSVKY
jgi:UDP-N-acetylglucosamine 2-epimerase (non-hydrolysing)